MRQRRQPRGFFTAMFFLGGGKGMTKKASHSVPEFLDLPATRKTPGSKKKVRPSPTYKILNNLSEEHEFAE